jgi:hypothetical protein
MKADQVLRQNEKVETKHHRKHYTTAIQVPLLSSYLSRHSYNSARRDENRIHINSSKK